MDAWTIEVLQNYRVLLDEGEKTFPVKINFGRLGNFAREVGRGFATPWRYREVGIHPLNDFAFAAHILWGNAVNFCFKDPSIPGGTYKVPSFLSQNPYGARAMWVNFVHHFGEKVPQSHDMAPHVFPVGALGEFFREPIPVLELRRVCLRDFTEGLLLYFGGNPLNLLEEAMVWNGDTKQWEFRAFNNGKGIIELLVEKFPIAYGSDIHEINGLRFGFYKRARLTALMLHLRSSAYGGKLPPVADIAQVGPFIDYQIPRFLHAKPLAQFPHLPILEYSKDLETRIEAGEEISSRSPDEEAIRISAFVACCHLSFQTSIPPFQLDQIMFAASRGLQNKAHFTRTSDY